MSRTLTLALACSASLALVAPAALAAPNDPDAAAAAGEYVATQVPADGNLGGAGGSADVALALLATGGHDAQVSALTDYLETQAASFAAEGGPAAGKLALVAAATGRDATDFGGVDLIAALQTSIKADGQCGSWGFAFGDALCILGLDRNGADVPAHLLEHAYSYQDPATGAFGFGSGDGFVAEADASGLMLSALAGVAQDRDAALSAAAVRDYLVESQTSDGYWENYSPINSTGLVAPALESVGVPQDDAVAWLAGQQLPDGGLPLDVDGPASNLMATAQGMLPFTGESYLSVGAGGTDTVDLVVTADTVERISGVDRYGTAAAASQDAYAPGVDTVYVATGTEFADALTGSALAGHQHAPILLVKPGSVPAVTAAELDRLNPASVVVLGGANSVSETVKTQVGSYAGGNVERIAGSERYATAAAVAQEFPAGDRVFVATGRQYADALAASAAAGAQGVPVLLVTQDSVPQATASALAELDPSFITLLGGTGSVSTGVATELGGYGEVTRVFGADRYATAAALSAQREGALGAVIATGVDFPDALTGAAYAAVANVPVLLVKPSSIPGATRTELDRLAARAVLVFGGTASVSEAVLTNLAEHNYAG